MHMQNDFEIKMFFFCINWITVFGWSAVFEFLENAVPKGLPRMFDAFCWFIRFFLWHNTIGDDWLTLYITDWQTHSLDDLMEIIGNIFRFNSNFCGITYFWLKYALQLLNFEKRKFMFPSLCVVTLIVVDGVEV